MRTSIAYITASLIVMGFTMTVEASDSNEPPKENQHLSSIVNIEESDKVIDFIKSYPVNKIEPGLINVHLRSLPEIPLDKWLASVMGNVTLEWKGGECAAYDSDNDDNDEHCVSFLVTANTPKEHCPSVELGFIVNTDATVNLMYQGSEVNDFGARGALEQIADLEKVLVDVKAKMVSARPSNHTIDRLRAKKGADVALFAAGLDVHDFDPSLPSERFDKWLERTADWSFNWMAYPAYFHQCAFTSLDIYVRPAVDAERQSPPVYISMTLGTWEEEIKVKPKLYLYKTGQYPSGIEELDPVENLSALKKVIDAWKAAPKLITPKITAPKPSLTTNQPRGPVVQNMIRLGYFSRTWSTPTGHCYGHILGLWKYGERVFGTHEDIGGQCADSQEPVYIIRDVKYDPTTGRLEFWSYGTPGHQFVGKIEQDVVTGKFLGMYEQEEVKLKRSKDRDEPITDSDKNVEIWCKAYAPNIRNIVKEELNDLCKLMGVQ